MLKMNDLHEFFRSEYAPVFEKPEHRLLIQNFIEFYNGRHAAQQSVKSDCCPRCGSNSWRDAIVPDTLEICTVCGNSR